MKTQRNHRFSKNRAPMVWRPVASLNRRNRLGVDRNHWNRWLDPTRSEGRCLGSSVNWIRSRLTDTGQDRIWRWSDIYVRQLKRVTRLWESGLRYSRQALGIENAISAENNERNNLFAQNFKLRTESSRPIHSILYDSSADYSEWSGVCSARVLMHQYLII